ncbi:hypothetical protein V5799_013401, partial [Amblyomma americanum]
ARHRNPERWIKDTDDIYMAWMSGYEETATKVKCLKSKYCGMYGPDYHRNIEFYELEKNNWIYRRFNVVLEWRTLPGKANEPRLETAHIFGYPLPEAIHSTYAILFASPFCIIFGAEFPPLNVKTDCTCWTKFHYIENLHWECKFILDHYCKKPTNVVNKTGACWK